MNYNHTKYQIQEILRDKSFLEKFYPESKNEFSEFLLKVLKEDRYDLFTRAEIAGDELYKIINQTVSINNDSNDSILVPYKFELQSVLANLLKQKIKKDIYYNEEIQNLYLKNLEDILEGSRKIVITKQANTLMRELILSHPYEYLKKFLLREHPEGSLKGVNFFLDPFLFYYFDNDWNTFISLLYSPEIKMQFQKSQEEKNFYQLLLNTVDIAKTNNKEFFLIEDKSDIALIKKFIYFVQKPIEIPNTSFFNLS